MTTLNATNHHHAMIDIYFPAAGGSVTDAQAAAAEHGLDALVYVAHNPEDRYPDASEFLDDLRQAQKRLSAPPPPTPKPAAEPAEQPERTVTRSSSREAVVFGLIGLALFVFVALIVLASVLAVMFWPTGH